MTKRGKSLSRLALHMRSHPLCYWSEPFDTSAQSTCDLFTRHTHATALSCLHTPGALRLFCRIWISVSFMIMISCRSMCVEDEAAIASPPLTDSGAAPFLRSAALCLQFGGSLRPEAAREPRPSPVRTMAAPFSPSQTKKNTAGESHRWSRTQLTNCSKANSLAPHAEQRAPRIEQTPNSEITPIARSVRPSLAFTLVAASRASRRGPRAWWSGADVCANRSALPSGGLHGLWAGLALWTSGLSDPSI